MVPPARRIKADFIVLHEMRPVEKFHAAASFLHGVSLILMIWFWVDTDSRNYPKVYTTDVVWRQKLDRSASCTDVQSGCVIVSSLSEGHSVNVYAIFCAFFLVSALAEGCYACITFAGKLRWLEYALSASLQTFVIAVVCNVVNVFAALLSALMVGTLQYFGYAIEQGLPAEQGLPDEQELSAEQSTSIQATLKLPKLKFRAVSSSSDENDNPAPAACKCGVLELACGFLMLLFAWIPIFYHYFDNLSGPPLFVHFIFWFTFVAYCLFGVVMALQWEKKLSKEQAEFGYTTLSLLSKLLVAWVYVGGTYMRDGKIESTT